MKLAVTSSGDALESTVDQRFGRAAWIVVYDTASRQSTAVDNSRGMDAAQGAGIQAAEAVSRLGAECLITGHCGPKAFRALAAAGIKVYTGAGGTVAEAIAAFESGKLAQAAAADVEGHW
jgi:predicted Fe-Mo cluster-binding NifX family protein